MSAYSQQEELEQFKVWWKSYGMSVVVGVVLGVALLVGYRYWTQHRETQREAASALYDQMLEQARANKPEAIGAGEKLIAEYDSTPYAGMAALLLARRAYENGDKAQARQRLEWAVANTEGAAQHAARLRLARLLLDAGEVAPAAALAEAKDIVGFEAEYYELRGDIALAQQQHDAARAAYAEALKQLAPSSPYRPVLSMKLDDLGGAK